MTVCDIAYLKEKAKVIRHSIIDMVGCEKGKTGHLGGSCSIADVVAALYFHKMKHDPANPAAADGTVFCSARVTRRLPNMQPWQNAATFPGST